MTGGHGAVEGGDKRTALVIAVLALFLAIVETGAKSAQTQAITLNVEAANLWAFFQARTIRQTTVRASADAAELQKVATGDAAVRAAIEAQQKAWRDQAARWEDSTDGEGRKQLSERARLSEIQRERYMSQYHLYEYAAALLQVAIVIASASIITSAPWLILVSLGLAAGGAVLSGLGFFAPGLLHL